MLIISKRQFSQDWCKRPHGPGATQVVSMEKPGKQEINRTQNTKERNLNATMSLAPLPWNQGSLTSFLQGRKHQITLMIPGFGYFLGLKIGSTFHGLTCQGNKCDVMGRKLAARGEFSWCTFSPETTHQPTELLNLCHNCISPISFT